MVSRRKLPDPSLYNVFNLLSTSLLYILSFQWSDFGLKYLVAVMLKDQLPKFKASVWNFPISETGGKCYLVFRPADSNWVITVELKKKVEYNWTRAFRARLCFKGYRSLPWTLDGVIYYKVSIATGVKSTSIFSIFFKSSICIYSIRSRYITDSNLLM